MVYKIKGKLIGVFPSFKRTFVHFETLLCSVLYVQESLNAEPKVFIDPNELSDDGTVALQVTAFSKDDEIFSYGLSSCGSDWVTVHFKHVEKGIFNLLLAIFSFYLYLISQNDINV